MESELNVYEIASECITYVTDNYVKFESGITLHYNVDIRTDCSKILHSLWGTTNSTVTFYYLDTIIYGIKLNNVLHVSNGVFKKEDSLYLTHPDWY